jgi:diadenosine tetraphosphate (Ap4A) HIT family hydrolase
VENASELGWAGYADLQSLVFRATLSIERCFAPARVYVAELGASSELPMSYPHYHWHVVPVPETDDRARPARVFSWSEGVIAYSAAELRRLALELRAAFPESTGKWAP